MIVEAVVNFVIVDVVVIVDLVVSVDRDGDGDVAVGEGDRWVMVRGIDSLKRQDWAGEQAA